MQQDFDGIIDKTAEQIVRREPSNALTDAVMASIVDRRSSIVHRRFAWATAGAGAAACGLIALLMLNRTPPQTRQAPTSAPAAVAAPLEMAPATPQIVEVPNAERAVPINRVMRPSRPVMLPPIEDDFASAVAPITVAPISFDSLDIEPVQVSSLDLPPLLDVEPLTVSPLDN